MAIKRTTVAALSVSAATLVGIATYEGYSGTAYDDGVGINTIGFGTTEGVKPGDKIDPVRALIRLNEEADRISREIAQCIKVPLAQHEWDSFVSFSYNVGSGAFCRSTLLKKLNTGDYTGACDELLRWNKAGGKVMRGLTKRRDGERKLCLGPETPPTVIAAPPPEPTFWDRIKAWFA